MLPEPFWAGGGGGGGGLIIIIFCVEQCYHREINVDLFFVQLASTG